MILMVTVFLLFNYIYVQSHPCGSSCCKPSRIAQAGVSSPWQASCQRCNSATIACKSPICARRVAMCAAVSAFTSPAWRAGFSCKRSRMAICCREKPTARAWRMKCRRGRRCRNCGSQRRCAWRARAGRVFRNRGFVWRIDRCGGRRR